MTARVITSIDPHPRRPGRYLVEVDGETVATASVSVIDRLGLDEGREWDTVENEVLREGAILDAFDKGANLLAARSRSGATLLRLLLRRGVEQPVARSALDRLRDAGFVDDAAFARQVARSRATAGFSRRRIAQELFRAGIERSLAVEAIEETFEAEALDEGAIVEEAAIRKARSLTGMDPARRRRRLWAYLARRGYSVDHIRAAVASVESETGSDDSS
jgi:regulatory protein